MFYCLIDRTLKACANQSFRGRTSAASLILFSAALGSACGGHSSSMSNQAPNSGPSTNLNVSGTLPAASVGTSYSGSITASGGTAPYSFAVVSGQLPNGVGLAKDSGTISGTPSAAGTYNFVISALDSAGNSQQKALQISVSNNTATSSGGSSGGGSSSGGSTGSGSSSGGTSGGTSSSGTSTSGTSTSGKSFSNLQSAGGWGQYGQGPPNFVDCSPSPCDGITFSMQQQISNPSKSGSATQFNLGGTTPYSDALWNNHVMGPLSSQGTFDTNGTLVPTIYNFTYDADFYGDNFGLAEALEFDINQFFGGMGFIFGHECRIASGNQWDIWDNGNAKWVPTGVPCHPNSNAWNHVTLKVQRTSDNHMTYQSISLNGQTTTLNWTFQHGSAPNWYGVTVNYQMDGNVHQDSYSIYLDNLTLTYQ